MQRDIEIVLRIRQDQKNNETINQIKRAISEIGISIPESFGKFVSESKEQIKGLSREISSLHQSIGNVRSSFNGFNTSIDSCFQSLDTLDEKSKTVREEIAALSRANRVATKEQGNLARSTIEEAHSYKNLNNAVETTTRAIEDLSEKTATSGGFFSKGMSSLSGLTKGIFHFHKASDLMEGDLERTNAELTKNMLSANAAAAANRNLVDSYGDFVDAIVKVEQGFRRIQEM
jgi:chromosome segregation ATPase